LKPKNSAYQNDVAYGLNNLGRFEEAIQYAEKALKLNPRSGVAYSNKGFALDALGKLDEAIECYDKAIDLVQPIPMPTTTSPLQFSNGQNRRGHRTFGQSTGNDPDDLDAITSKGYCLNELGKYEKAIECFDTAIENIPKIHTRMFAKPLPFIIWENMTTLSKSATKPSS